MIVKIYKYSIIDDNYETDVSFITQLHTLKELEIQAPTYPYSEGSILNIEQLKNLINLERLSISYLGGIDLSWITCLKELKEIRLYYCTIDDLSPLSVLTKLEVVDLNLSKVKNIASLLESKSIKIISGPIVENGDDLFHLFRERGIEYYPHGNR